MEEGKEGCVATQPPSPAETAEYFRAHGRPQSDADKFHAYNQMKGWKIGRTPITDWKAAADMWISLEGKQAGEITQPLDEWGKPIKPEFWNG